MRRIPKSPREYIASILIFILLVSQTIHVSFFDSVNATQNQYRDIVSLYIDADTYRAIRPKVMRYAEDIQTYLGSTQISILVVNDDTPVQSIAAQNEKLYYEGSDPGKIDRLVGTIIIGNVPIPMVQTESDIFPSVYPYVDFVDKKFTFQEKFSRYVIVEDANQKTLEPEIWHGVINPAIGRKWDMSVDVSKISDFLDKTHDFYSKQGVFTESNISPRVFYYDGFNESAATDHRSVFQYGLNMKNSENIAYKRLTKYLLTDINTALSQYDVHFKKNDNNLLQSFGITSLSDTLDSDTISKLPDIQTKAAIDGLLKDFYAIINKKTLGDQLNAVRNAGRYSDGDAVRADIAATMVTSMDIVARNTLFDANRVIMDNIDKLLIDRGYAKDIPIFDTFSQKIFEQRPDLVDTDGSSTGITNEFTYQNYYFGQKSNSIVLPEQCSIARGSRGMVSEFGRSLLVEANSMYDTVVTPSHAAKLEADTTKLVDIHRNGSFACFDSATSRPKSMSYWGDNSLLWLSTSNNNSDILSIVPEGTSLSGMTESVFSLNGMKETERFAPATIGDCMSNKYQYALENPTPVNYYHPYAVSDVLDYKICTRSNLSEWNIRGSTCPDEISSKAPNPLQYSCLSQPKQLVRTNIFAQEIDRYKNTPCINGTLILNGNTLINPSNLCIKTYGSGDGVYTVDETIYENVTYHTIPSILRHISPTDSELSAAKDTGVTPSLPVDMIRYVEFLTPKGNIARINYPNFFVAEGDDVPSFRAWLRTQSESDWLTILAQEGAKTISAIDAQANAYLNAGVLPMNPIDWNMFISDEMILKIIQSRNWLNPDITTKYRKSIEDMLSYSQGNNPTNVNASPQIPRANNMYEVAYLGLSSFMPETSISSGDFSMQVDNYNTFRSKLRAINISEDTNKYGAPSPAPSDKCGPPDGVNLFQWPSAITCWIKSLTPIRIVGMACGANMIGMKSSITAQQKIPTTDDTGTINALMNFYSGGKLTYNISHTTILPDGVAEIEFYYQKDSTILGFPPNTKIELNALSGRDVSGKKLAQEELQRFVQVAPNSNIITENGGKFLVSANGYMGDIVLQASVGLMSSDEQSLRLISDPLPIRITDEYLDIIPRVGQDITSIVDVTSSTGMSFDYRVMNQSGGILEPKFPLTLSIFDEIGGIYTATGIDIQDSNYILPSVYTSQLGVYRLDFVDADDREGRHSIGIQAGPLSRTTIVPVSSSMLRGSTVPVTLRLQDALGNPISPDLHSVDIRVTSGYIVMPSGERRTEATVDLMDSEYIFSVGTDTLDPVGISVKIDDTISHSTTLSVFASANVVLERQNLPMVGGVPQDVLLRVQSAEGTLISGFNSIAHLTLPEGAGYFSPSVVAIRNGVSDKFNYIPGQIAGDHNVTVSIPGLGIIPDIRYSVSAGDPLYITHAEKGENIVFSLRDRYDNLSPASLTGTLQINTNSPIAVNFTNGILSRQQVAGITSVDVPRLADNSIYYNDVDSVFSITGSRFYTTYVAGSGKTFDFHDDYNARYTVLAGGSFLREAEDILYNTKAGSGQSLAVTTLLDTPYVRDGLLSIVPGGQYSLYTGTDTILEPTLTIDNGYPKIVFRDSITQNIIADAVYRATNPQLNICIQENCQRSKALNSEIELTSLSADYIPKKVGSTMTMLRDQTSVITFFANGQIQYVPGVSLTLSDEQDDRGVIIDIHYSNTIIGQIHYRTSSKKAIVSADSGLPTSDTVTFQVYSQSRVNSFGATGFDSEILGIQVLRPEAKHQVLDMTKSGPETMDSFGVVSEQPNVGWQGSNRTLLAYAGGSTVGESTRWFHTYTMINLGDPVTHNDRSLPGTEYDGLDRSLGTQLTSSNGSSVLSYQQVDMNADGYEDILVLHADGYIELLLNLVDRIQSKGNIAHIPDIISRGFAVGDFTGDDYGDILGVDRDGEFVLIDNSLRRFSHRAISVQAGMSLPRNVNQFQIRDMDMDNRDDIVYVSDAGELAILYGTSIGGVYEKKVLDTTLGITLSNTPIITGGAIYTSSIPQYSLESSSASGELDESRLYREVYYPFSLVGGVLDTQASDTTTLSGVIARDKDLDTLSLLEKNYALTGVTNSQLINIIPPVEKNYIRSEYAQSQGLTISKTYKHVENPILRAGDTVRTTIEITNTTSKKLSDIKYLDSIPTIFDSSNTKSYTTTLGTSMITREFSSLEYSDFGAYFNLLDIPAGATLKLSYDLSVLPASYGELLVGDYERGEIGHDVYGDVAFKTDTTCGADMMLWRSDSSREYTRGTRTFSDAIIPASIADKITDTDNNGIPDSIENMTIAQQKNLLNTISSSTPSTDRDIVNISLDPNRQMLDVGFDEASVAAIQNQVQDIMDGLACGFGGGSCMSFPMNWAPLAPGSAPVAFGYPLSDLVPSTGTPIFSALTCQLITLTCGTSPCTLGIPLVYPASKMGANTYGLVPGSNNGAACANVMKSDGAGGKLGINSLMNSMRIFVTPTLTLGAGAAFCFGQPAIKGRLPPPSVWPLAPGGNCIVVAKPMSMCKDDGSAADGDVRGISGLGTLYDTWNAKSCTIQADTGGTIEDESLRQDILSYIGAPDKSKLTGLYNRLGSRTSKTITGGPLLRIGGVSSGGALAGVDITLDSAKPFDLGNIVKLNNKRISGFPDFIMDWIARQTDQITNALLTPPNLIIIPPTSVGQNAQFDGTIDGFTDTFKDAYSQTSINTISAKAGDAYASTVESEGASQVLINQTQSSKNNAQSDLGKWIQSEQNSFDTLQDSVFKSQLGKIANQGKGGIVAMRTAYKLIGKLPLISISEKTIPVNVPWILPQELDKYSRALDVYSKEFNNSIDSFCSNDPSPECVAQKMKLQSSGLQNSINRNLKIIEEYKNFPVKLQKYVTWKQRYLSQVLCYITEVQQMTTGWVKDNSIRFQKWAELIVLIRAIADSWQPVLDIVAQKNAQCEVCHNERYNAKYYKYKIISALIPSIPVIQFPRWPDIVLDLSDVRLGIVLVMPNFQFNLKPIRLPDLPRFTLPRAPNGVITLPNLPIIPPIPTLPELPDLPAIPTIKLPNLPPPPKLPKLFSSLGVVLNILKFFQIMECYVNKTTLVPEWTVGDVIAQRTERQGTLPMDFLDISFPQFSIPSIREIRVSSHINFELRSEFIAEFAQAAVQPINAFGADLGRALPKKVGEDIRIDSPSNININIQSSITDSPEKVVNGYIEQLEKDASIVLNIEEFKAEMKKQYSKIPEFSSILGSLDEKIAQSHKDAQNEEKKLIAYHDARFQKLRKYIDQQYAETAQMQNIIDLLNEDSNKILSSATLDRALLVSDNIVRESQVFAAEWNNSQRDAMTSTTEPADSLIDQKSSINSRLKRIIAATSSTESSSTSTSPLASGYAPNYQGIYIITEGGNQIRLFDYIEPLLGNDKATRIDIDRDGDMDYLFLLDGALYLKRATLKNIPKIIDTKVTHSDIDSDSIPTAPDFFHEYSILSRVFSFSYRTTQDIDSFWRLEFYDRYMEWDMIQVGTSDSVSTPRGIIEIISQDSPWFGRTTRTLQTVGDPSTFVIEGPRMEILTGSIDFVTSPGRILYSGDKRTTFLYSTGSAEPYIRMSLNPAEQIYFDEVTNISLQSGKLFILYPSVTGEKYVYNDAMIGMPITPEMRISSLGGEVTLRDHIDNTDIKIDAGGTYQYERVKSLNDDYAIQVPYTNGFYFPRIGNLYGKGMTRAGEILFAPRASSDISAPLVTLDSRIRIPVYQKKEIFLRDIITEMSDYTVHIDSDLTQDTDANGTYDDDFLSSSSGVTINDQSITFGPFDTIGTRSMMLQVKDEFNNLTIAELPVEIYTPVPTLMLATNTGIIQGSLDESLQNEPIDIFRLRTGTDIRLLNQDSSFMTSVNGGFEGVLDSSKSGSVLSYSGNEIALSERGLLGTLPTGYTAEVILADIANPMHLVVKSEQGVPLYRQFFVLPENPSIIDISSFSGEEIRQGLWIRPTTGYSMVRAGVSDPSIPGGVYLTDSMNHPLIAIARDGNIYPTGSGVSTSFTQRDGYPQISLRIGEMTFADVLYKFDFFYTLK